MGLNLIIGRGNIDKERFVYDSMNQCDQRKAVKKQLLIVPEQFTLEAENKLIETLKLKGTMDIEILSFSRLAYRVLNEFGGKTRIHINEQGKNMMLYKILKTYKNELSIYGHSVSKKGFVSLLNQFIGEIKQYNIMPEEIEASIKSMDQETLLYSKMSDINNIYNQFEMSMENKYIDSEDYMNLLIEKLSFVEWIKEAEIWIYGFDSYNLQLINVIAKLMMAASDVNIALTMDRNLNVRDRDLFYSTRKTMDQFLQLAESKGIESKIIDLNKDEKYQLEKTAVLNHIEKEFYAYPCETLEIDENYLELYGCSNAFTEIEGVAVKITELVRDQNYAYKDIVVLCSEIETYALMVKRIFRDYEIPFFLDQKRGITHNPIIEGLLSMLEIIIKNYKYEDVFRFLKTGFSNLSDSECEVLENYVLRYGIKYDLWKKPFCYGAENIEKSELENLNEIREKFIKPFELLEAALKGKMDVKSLTEQFYYYLTKTWGVQEKIDDWVSYLKEKNEFEYVKEISQIWNFVIQLFQQLIEIIGEEKISLKEYKDMLELGFETAELGLIPTTLDQVIVGSVARTKPRDMKALFLIGVNDGKIPSVFKEGEILSDSEKMALENKGLYVGKSRFLKSYEEKITIYNTLIKSSHYLWVSYPLSDYEGKALRPSLLIERLKKIVSNLKEKTDLMTNKQLNKKDDLSLIQMPQSTFKNLIEMMRHFKEGEMIPEIWWDVYSWYSNKKDWKNLIRIMEQGLFYQNQESLIGKNLSKNLYGTPLCLTPSRLEKFAKCPYAHFLEYGLGLKERKILKIERADLGSIFHEILLKFTQRLKENEMEWSLLGKEQSNQYIKEIVVEIKNNYRDGYFTKSKRFEYQILRIQKVAQRVAWMITKQIKNGDFENFNFEVGFGAGRMYPPIEIVMANGEKVMLEGRIDRVDLLNIEGTQYVKIIDYKSGNKNFDISDIYSGLQLQLIIYLTAVIEGIKRKKDVKPAGMFYFKIEDPMIQTETRISEEIEKEIQKMFKMKGLVLEDIRIIKSIDNEINSSSTILPASIKKDGSIGKKSSVISGDAFDTLVKDTQFLIGDIAEQIYEGNIDIYPAKKDQWKACEYCKYKSICQFDLKNKSNKYKKIRKDSTENN